jgi:3-oxoadipate enol-lactonase
VRVVTVPFSEMARRTLQIDRDYGTEVVCRGEGDPMVLVHGTPLDARTWERFELPGRRLIAYDLRAHGSASAAPPALSYEQLADDLGAVLDSLSIDKAEVLGHSFGGQVVQCFGARHPERVSRLWIVCSRTAPFPPFAAAAERIEREGLAPVAAGALERWFTASEREAGTEAVAYARSCLDEAHTTAYAAALRLIAPFDLPESLRPAPFPTVMIAAERDQVATAEVMGEGARLCEGELRLAHDRGHMLPLQDPALLARLMA